MADFSINILLKANDQAGPVVRSLLADTRKLNSASAAGRKGGGARGGFFGAASLSSAASGVQQLTSMAKGAVSAPIALAANFEQALNSVDAFSGNTFGMGEQLKNIEKRARELGASTEFTATQVLGSYEVMTLAGFTYEQQMKSIAAQVDFATAGNVEMAQGTEVLGTVLGAFSKDAGEAQEVADILAKTSTKTGSNILMMGQSMKDVGPVANALGLDVRDTAELVGVLGKSFINGGRAGKALKSILLDIDPTKKIGKDLTRALGIKRGEMKEALASGDASAPFRLLQSKFDEKGLDGGDQMKVLKGIFGKRRAAEVALLLEATKGDKEVEGSFAFFHDQLESTDEALATMAAKKREGTKGSAKELSSALQELGITVGQELLPVLAPLIEDAKKAAVEFAAWAKANPELVKTLGKLGVGIVAVGTVLAPVLLSMSAMQSLLALGAGSAKLFGANIGLAKNPTLLLAAGTIALGLAISQLITDMGKLNVEQATLNTLQREGISLQLGLKGKRQGSAKLEDLTPDERKRLDSLQARKAKLAEEKRNISALDEFMFGGDETFLGIDARSSRGSDTINSDIASVNAEIDAIDQAGLKRGADKAAGGTASLEQELLSGRGQQTDAETLRQARSDAARASAQINALTTDSERVQLDGGLKISVEDNRTRVTKTAGGNIPLEIDAGQLLE